MSPSFFLMGLLGPAALAAAASPYVVTLTLSDIPTHTITSTETVYPSTCAVYANVLNAGSYVTTLPGASIVTEAVYASSMTVSGGETVTISGTPTVIASSTVITDCPCTKATTISAPGATLTLNRAVGGSSVITTNIVYPSSVTCVGGETITISGNPTVIAGPTVITDCPCTLATTVTVAGATVTAPAPTITANAAFAIAPVVTVVNGVTVTRSVTLVEGVTVTAAPASGTATAPRTYVTTVGDATFLVEEQINYDGTELALNAKNKRQLGAVTLDICLETCSDNLSCVGTSFNTDASVCLYFSAIFPSSRRSQVEITFATVIRRITPTGTSILSTSATGTSTSGTSSTSPRTGTSSAGTSSTGLSSASASSTGTPTSGTSSSSTTPTFTQVGNNADPSSAPDADPSSAPDADLIDTVVSLVAKATGLTARNARVNEPGSVVRRGGMLRRSDAEPAAKHAPRKVLIEL